MKRDPFDAVDGEAARLMRATDWAATPLGAVDGWSAALRTTVSMLLLSRHPMFLFWGPSCVQFYNDAFIPRFGDDKHPRAMGQNGAECWPEIWTRIWPDIEAVFQRRIPTWHQDALVPVRRDGRLHDVYWTYGYSAVVDDDGRVGGVLVVCSETTEGVVARMRQHEEHRLESALVDCASAAHVRQAALDALAGRPLLGAAVLLRWPEGFTHAVPPTVDLPTPAAAASDAPSDVVRRALAEAFVRAPLRLPELAALRAGEAELRGGALDVDVAVEALADTRVRVGDVRLHPLPALPHEDASAARFALALALYPRLPFDAAHRAFLDHLAGLVAAAAVRAEMHRARRVAEEERDSVLLQAPVAAALLHGPQLEFRLANPLYAQLVGVPEAALVGRRFRDVFPRERSMARALEHVMRHGGRRTEREAPLRSLDAEGREETRWFASTIEPLRTLSGDVAGVVVVGLDVTAQVLAREAAKRADTQHARLLAEAQSAVRAKDEFLAMLGHELRNPLAPIVSALHVMDARGDTATARERAVIRRQVAHMVRLVDDLMDVARIARGKVALTPGAAPVAELLARAVEMTRPLVDQRRHALQVELPEPGLIWRGDEARFVQIVTNLLTNAARYTTPGGHLALRGRGDGAWVVVEVEDDGQGIDVDLLPHMFEAFVQGGRGTHRATAGGLGLGLALVKNLTALHGGEVHAHSDGPGRGARFVVRMPLDGLPRDDAVAGAEAAAAPASRDVAARLAPRRVLVVDDNADAADGLALMLAGEGHAVKVAYDPLDAMALLDRGDFTPDVALLDLDLPGLSGHDLARRLRAREGGATLPLIALSGYGQPSERERAAQAGFARFVVKPMTIETLRRALRDVLPRSTPPAAP